MIRYQACGCLVWRWSSAGVDGWAVPNVYKRWFFIRNWRISSYASKRPSLHCQALLTSSPAPEAVTLCCVKLMACLVWVGNALIDWVKRSRSPDLIKPRHEMHHNWHPTEYIIPSSNLVVELSPQSATYWDLSKGQRSRSAEGGPYIMTAIAATIGMLDLGLKAKIFDVGLAAQGFGFSLATQGLGLALS